MSDKPRDTLAKKRADFYLNQKIYDKGCGVDVPAVDQLITTPYRTTILTTVILTSRRTLSSD